MFLTIFLRKEVADVPQAEDLVQIVRDKLADRPDVEVTASVSEQIQVELEPT